MTNTTATLFDADQYGREHPVPYSRKHLAVLDRLLPASGLVLDPYAGVGSIHRLARGDRRTIGVELELEWARARVGTIVGDIAALPFPAALFDAIATSPAYGNRCADQSIRPDADTTTYAHMLGRPCSPGSGAALQWGPEYRAMHEIHLDEMIRVLRPGGRLFINMKDHIRDGERQHVTAWWVSVIGDCATVLDQIEITTGGNRKQEHPNDLPEVIIVAEVRR